MKFEKNNYLLIDQNEEVENAPLIQIIDEDVSLLILLKDALEENGWMVIANTDPNKAIEQYFELNPDCLIIDVNLALKKDFQLLEDIQVHNINKFLPKIMISHENTREIRIKAYQKGADDFIKKPIDLEEFLVRVHRQLQKKQIFDQFVLLDELTQVYNRRFFHDIFGRSIQELQRIKSHFSIALIDLDLFKNVNDTYGHVIGDKVLAKFGQYLKENIRNIDYVFRYGGEEFVILFSSCNDKDTVEILSRLLDDFRKVEFQSEKGSFYMTFSAGVFFVNDYNILINTAIHSANSALNMAKQQGRAKVISSNVMISEFAKRKLNVSIVDDDDIIRTMLVKVFQSIKLEQWDINIQVFEDGLKFFESNRLDEQGNHFLILDGVMPVMDGIEILQKVKEGKNKERVNVLMLAARKSEKDIARALKLGADDYVTKPFSILELQARIQRLIQRTH